VLQAALNKLTAQDFRVDSLNPEECDALRAYAVNRLADPQLSEGERKECHRIQELLPERSGGEAVPPNDTEALRRRNNWTLRNAIEKGIRGTPGEIDPHELRLMENTLRELSALSEPAANHLRLLRLLEQTLDAYYNFYAESVTAKPASSVTSVEEEIHHPSVEISSVSCETFFQGAQRQKLDLLGPLTIGQNLYTYEHSGNLRLHGDMPQDKALIVHDGDLCISGSVSGVVEVDGDIKVEGNLSGGTLLSNSGSIALDRVLAGSRLLTLRGDATCSTVERASLIYCAGQLKIAGPVVESRILCRRGDIKGAITRGRVSFMEELVAESITRDPSKPCIVEFRGVLSNLDFGGELEDHEAHTIKEYVRGHFEVEQTRVVDRALTAYYLNLQRVMLYLLEGGADQTVASVCDLHAARTYYSILQIMGRELLLAVQRTLELHGLPDVTVSIPALDVCQRGLRHLKGEAEALPQDLATQRKQKILSAVSQLSNLAKQIRDSGGQNLGGHYLALRERVVEWNNEVRVVEEVLLEAERPLAEKLGEPIMTESKPDRLPSALRLAQEKATSNRSRLLPPLKKLVDHHTQNASRWTTGLEEALHRQQQSTAILEETGAVQFLHGHHGIARIGAGGLGEGTLVLPAGFPEPQGMSGHALAYTATAHEVIPVILSNEYGVVRAVQG
jgi:hypothetical protein